MCLVDGSLSCLYYHLPLSGAVVDCLLQGVNILDIRELYGHVKRLFLILGNGLNKLGNPSLALRVFHDHLPERILYRTRRTFLCAGIAVLKGNEAFDTSVTHELNTNISLRLIVSVYLNHNNSVYKERDFA